MLLENTCIYLYSYFIEKISFFVNNVILSHALFAFPYKSLAYQKININFIFRFVFVLKANKQ